MERRRGLARHSRRVDRRYHPSVVGSADLADNRVSHHSVDKGGALEGYVIRGGENERKCFKNFHSETTVTFSIELYKSKSYVHDRFPVV